MFIFSLPTEVPLNLRYEDPINAFEENNCTKQVNTFCGQMQTVLVLNADGTNIDNCALEDRECDWHARI
jgi:hypothetical protein